MYWDTSALLKLYVSQPDSARFVELMVCANHRIISSVITSVEMWIVLYRKERGGDLKPGSARIILKKFSADQRQGRVIEIPFGPQVLEEAKKLARLNFRQPLPFPLRSLDAIHVSSAVAAGARSFVAADGRVRQVAKLAGLQPLP